MGGHLELIWFGLAVAGIGAGFAFIFWSALYEEGDEHYAPMSARITGWRLQLVIAGLLVAALGLTIVIWHAIKLIFT
jgi:dipeptide/tripeptide permease